jgi:TPR repeat protein
MDCVRQATLAFCLAIAAPAFGAQPLEEALSAYSRGEYTRAMQLFLPLAREGNAQAQYHLGNLYALGDGPAEEPDPDRMAARWYFESAQQGNADAQYALGLLFLSGKGVVRSDDEARKWFARAANGGHADAQRFLSDFTPRR